MTRSGPPPKCGIFHRNELIPDQKESVPVLNESILIQNEKHKDSQHIGVLLLFQIICNDNPVYSWLRSWHLKILQYECGSPMIAPDGCLQYHTGVSGEVSSFNWKLEDNSNDQMFSNSLANLSYSVCVRRESGYCSIDWSPGISFQVGWYKI